MNLLLAIQSYEKATPTISRHWPYYLKAGADEIHGIGTTNGNCVWPEGVKSYQIGEEGYIGGDRLPRRMVDIISHFLSTEFSHLCLIEHDVVFYKEIPRDWSGVWGKLAGGRINNSYSSFFVHCPWFMDRESAERIVASGRPMLKDIKDGSPEEGADIFLAWVCEANNIPIQFDLMDQYTRNSLDIPWQMEEARQARIAGAGVIHGVKTAKHLERLNYDGE